MFFEKQEGRQGGIEGGMKEGGGKKKQSMAFEGQVQERQGVETPASYGRF